MNKISFPFLLGNVIKNIGVIFSTIAALCLFVSPSIIAVAFVSLIFLIVLATTAFDTAKPPLESTKNIRIIRIILATIIICCGFSSFYTSWSLSISAHNLTNSLHIDLQVALPICGFLLSAGGFYAIYILSGWIELLIINLIKEHIKTRRESEIMANLKHNWYLPVSALFYFIINASATTEYFVGILIAVLISLAISTQIPSVWAITKKRSVFLRVISALTAIGVALGCKALTNPFFEIPIVLIYIGIAASLFFVYFCVINFWNKFLEIFEKHRTFCDIKIAEWVLYGVLLVSSLVFVTFSFVNSQAFYETGSKLDIVYTSDSPFLHGSNVYLSLTHHENDLRQPLFAIFSAPFVGIPYLIVRIIGASETVVAILFNYVQIVLLLAANLILTKMMKLNSLKRVCFMVLTSCTYMQILFTITMEQYIISYFWLILYVYLASENKSQERLATWGAGGTMITSIAFLPFLSDKSPIKDFKGWISDAMKSATEFLAVILAFCRLDVLYNITKTITLLSQFTGVTITFVDKICQYSAFIYNCFFAPSAGVDPYTMAHISWQLNPIKELHIAGIIILALAVLGAILNRDKKCSLLASGWILVSVVILVGLGWGTIENGLILYSLYFGWAFLLLIFQLVEKIEEKLKVRFIVPVVSVIAAVSMLAVNIPGMCELLDFAFTYYPV